MQYIKCSIFKKLRWNMKYVIFITPFIRICSVISKKLNSYLSQAILRKVTE